MSNSPDQAQVQSSKSDSPSKEEPTPGEGASIYLAFHGLMCFAHNSGTRLCEVGVHSKASDHEFKLHAFELDPSVPSLSPIYSFEPDSHDDVPGGVVSVEISEPTEPGVYYHYGTDDLSWRQLVDFEGDYFYRRKLEKKKRTLKPKIKINHGRFFVIPTPKRFLRITEGSNEGLDIGRIAYVCVATVRHASYGTIKIKTRREELRLRASSERPLLIFFSNACPSDECSANESDFHQYYKAFKIKSHEKKYRLEVIPDSEKAMDLRGLSFLQGLFQQEALKTILSNTDAPCGPGNYSRSSGTDDSAD
jgi:hypothetical protein